MSLKKIIRRTTQQAPSGYVLGRRSPGVGPVELLKLSDLRALGVATAAQVAAGSSTHGFGFSISGRPSTGQIIGIASWPAQMTFVSADPGDVAVSNIAATASAFFSLQTPVSGIWTEVGRITWSAAGTTGATTWTGGTFQLPANQQLRVVAPSPQDATLSDISAKVVGTQG